jgi:hypothetical protein
LNFESKTHEAWLEDPKAKQKLKNVIEKKEPQNQQVARKAVKPKKEQKNAQNQTPPETTSPLPSQCKLSPLDRHYLVSSLNHPVSKSSTKFVHNLSPFGNGKEKNKMGKFPNLKNFGEKNKRQFMELV